MQNSTNKVIGFLVQAKEEMNSEEFKQFIAMNASISLGVIHGDEGDQFYQEFLKGAAANPVSLKLEKGTMQ